MAIRLKRNDTSPALRLTARDDQGAVVDLTGASAKFLMRGAFPPRASKVDAAAVVETPAGGVLRYDWVAGDLDTAGNFDAEFEVTLSGGGLETFPKDGWLRVTVDEDLG